MVSTVPEVLPFSYRPILCHRFLLHVLHFSLLQLRYRRITLPSKYPHKLGVGDVGTAYDTRTYSRNLCIIESSVTPLSHVIPTFLQCRSPSGNSLFRSCTCTWIFLQGFAFN